MMLVRECDREEKNAIAETPATNNSMRRNKEKQRTSRVNEVRPKYYLRPWRVFTFIMRELQVPETPFQFIPNLSNRIPLVHPLSTYYSTPKSYTHSYNCNSLWSFTQRPFQLHFLSQFLVTHLGDMHFQIQSYVEVSKEALNSHHQPSTVIA